LAEKQKYFVFGLAKNFKIQLKIMRALWQIGAGFFDGEWRGWVDGTMCCWGIWHKLTGRMQNEIQPETSIKKTRKLAAAEAEAAAVPVTVSPVILCKILLKITAKENLHII